MSSFDLRCAALSRLRQSTAAVTVPLPAALLMRDRLNISVRPVSPLDELNVLSRRPEPTRHTIHERYKIVAVSAPEQSPRSFSSAELSHTFLSLNLCREIIRRVSTPDPRPVAFLARGREAVTRAKSTAGHAAASARWVEFARGTWPVRKRVPVASVAVRYDVEARMSVKVDERVCARRTSLAGDIKCKHTHAGEHKEPANAS